jgi:hypothetical protein
MWADQCPDGHGDGSIGTITDSDGFYLNSQSMHYGYGTTDFKGPVQAWFNEIEAMKREYVDKWPSE